MRQRYGTEGLFWKKKFYWDMTMALLVLFLPFTLYVHLLFDKHSAVIYLMDYPWEHGFSSNNYMIWYILVKFIPLALMIIWFLNNSYWWSYFLFIPIVFWTTHLARWTFYYPEIIENNLLLFVILVNIMGCICIILTDILISKKWRRISLLSPTKLNFISRKSLYGRLKSKTGSLEYTKQNLSQKDYINELTFLQFFLNKETNQFFHRVQGKFIFKKFDFFAVLAVIGVPLIYYSYELFPDDDKRNWLGIQSYGFKDVGTFIWYVGLKVSLIAPLSIWFITSRYWWRYAILSPIILSVYQIWEVLQNTSAQADEVEILQSLPVIFCVVAILIILSRIVNYRSKILELYDNISMEIVELLEDLDKNGQNDDISKLRMQLIKNNRNNEERTKENLEDLLKLKAQLTTRIENLN